MGLAVTFTSACLRGIAWSDPVSNCYLAFASNFGLDVSKGGLAAGDGRGFPARVLLLSVFLTGNVVFMGYRASLTSELSIREIQLPFTNLEGLLDSDFSLLLYNNGIYHDHFKFSAPNSTMGRLYKKHLGQVASGKRSTFYHTENAYKHLIASSRNAFYHRKEHLDKLEKLERSVIHCTNNTINSISILYT